MKNKFFTAEPVMDGVTVIVGLCGELAYLVEGTERALLIDGLTGFGSLKAFVRELTDLPVTLALTHGHIDHNGAAYEYGECYVHPGDMAMLFPGAYEKGEKLALGAHSDAQAKFDFLAGRGLPSMTLADVVQPCVVRAYPIFDGDVFDLGGVEIEVAELPGHTQGSVVFLDRARRILFSGDACNLNTLMGLPGSTTIEDYKEALEKFRTKYGGTFDWTYPGHRREGLPAKIIDDAIRLCGMILNGEDDHISSVVHAKPQWLALKRRPDYLPENGSLCNIQYSETKIRKRDERPVIRGGPIGERK